MQALPPRATLELMDWRTLCSSLQEIIDSDNPVLLREYLEQDPTHLTATDLEKNSLLILLLMGKAIQSALTLLREYGHKISPTHRNAQGRTALHYACSMQNTQPIIVELLQQDASVLEKDNYGWTPIHMAISAHNIGAISLISRVSLCGINTMQTMKPLFADQTNSPLHLAARSTIEMLTFVASLTDDFSVRDEAQRTALHHCLDGIDAFKNVEFLLDKGIPVDAVDAYGKTALGEASQRGSVALVDKLLTAGASQNKDRCPPIVLAYLHGHPHVAQKLMQKGISPDILIDDHSLYDICLAVEDKEFLALLAGARTSETTDIVTRCKSNSFPVNHSKAKKTVNNLAQFDSIKAIAISDPLVFEQTKAKISLDDWETKDQQGKTALFHLCEKGSILEVFRLLELGIDYETRDSFGNTILHAAILNNNTLVICLLLRHFKHLIPQTNLLGESALHIASRTGNLLAMKLLLQFGAQPNAVDKLKNTPLHAVANLESDTPTTYFQVIDLLLAKGATLEAKNQKSMTPVMSCLAVQQMIAFEYLLQKGANANVFDAEKQSMLTRMCAIGNHSCAEKLICHGANPSFKGATSPLIAACKISSIGLVTLLLNPKFSPKEGLSATANPNKAVGQETPMAATLENLLQVKGDPTSRAYDILKHLVEHGVDVDRTVTIRAKKIIPLAFAIEQQMTTVALLLISEGADIDKKSDGKTRPIELAAKKDQPQVVEALLKQGAKVPKRLLKANNLTANIKEILEGRGLNQPSSPPKLKRVMSWDDVRRSMTEPPDTPHPQAPALLVPIVTQGVQSITLAPKQLKEEGKLFKENTLDDELMRKAGMLSSARLLLQNSRTLPGSICRLGNTMVISMHNKVIIDKQSKLSGHDRDTRAQAVLTMLFNDIHPILGLHFNEEEMAERLQLLTKMDNIDDEKMKIFDIFTNKILNDRNRDIIVLKLLTKEAACMAIIPVQTQVRLYSEAHSKKIYLQPKPIRDQWEEIDVSMIPGGFLAQGKTTVGIDAKEKDQPNAKFAASVEVRAKIMVKQETGEVTITLARSNLLFAADASKKVREHIFKALNADITYNTKISRKE